MLTTVAPQLEATKTSGRNSRIAADPSLVDSPRSDACPRVAKLSTLSFKAAVDGRAAFLNVAIATPDLSIAPPRDQEAQLCDDS